MLPSEAMVKMIGSGVMTFVFVTVSLAPATGLPLVSVTFPWNFNKAKPPS